MPYWCPQYEELKENLTSPIYFAGEVADFSKFRNGLFVPRVASFYNGDGPYVYSMIIAAVYFGINISWLCMVWSAASIGTPTEPDGRDKYLRPLIIFQLIAGVCFPAILLAIGIHGVWYYRDDNYRCGPDVPPPDVPPDQFVYFHFFSILIITYALEVLFWQRYLLVKSCVFSRSVICFRKERGGGNEIESNV